MKIHKIEDKKPKEGKRILGFDCISNSWVVCSIVFGMSTSYLGQNITHWCKLPKKIKKENKKCQV